MELRKYLLGSEKEPEPEADRQLGLAALRKKNAACEHVVVVGEPGPASLALKMRGPDLCPHCTRREAAYWRVRAKGAEGVVIEAQRRGNVSGGCGDILERVMEVLDLAHPLRIEAASTASGGAAAPQSQISGAGSSGEKERGG